MYIEFIIIENLIDPCKKVLNISLVVNVINYITPMKLYYMDRNKSTIY